MATYKNIFIIAVLALLVTVPGLAPAATITFDYNSGIQDTQISNWWPTTPQGDLTSMAVYDHPVWEQQSLISFDNIFGNLPGQIPLGSTINDATLRLYVYGVQDPAQALELYRMNAPWSESTTWNSIGGGVTPGVQSESSPDAVTTGISVGFLDIAVSSSLTAWANGADNQGWVIMTDSSSGSPLSYANFSTSEGYAFKRPTLTVDYTPGGGPSVPEPGTMLLLASGVAAVGISRRKRWFGRPKV